MLKKIIPTLVVLALAASLVQAEVTYNEKLPVTWWVYPPCTGDVVELGGYVHALWTWTEDANGGIHMKWSESCKLQGEVVGPPDSPNLGAKYNGTINFHFYQWNIKKGETQTVINNLRMIGKGKAPNFTVHYTRHITVNANGEVTAVVDFEKVKCEVKPAPSKGDTITTKWGKIKSQY